MGELVQLVRQFFSLFRIWFIVFPWEQCVRIRAGKHVQLIPPGFHFMIPVIDQFITQSSRMRFACTSRQTITTSNGKTVTFAGAFGYCIVDILKLYQTLHHAEDTIRNIVQSLISQDISTHTSAEITPAEISQRVSSALNFEKYGLSSGTVLVTELVTVKTYRLIGDYGGYQSGSALSTELAPSNTPAPR